MLTTNVSCDSLSSSMMSSGISAYSSFAMTAAAFAHSRRANFAASTAAGRSTMLMAASASAGGRNRVAAADMPVLNCDNCPGLVGAGGSGDGDSDSAGVTCFGELRPLLPLSRFRTLYELHLRSFGGRRAGNANAMMMNASMAASHAAVDHILFQSGAAIGHNDAPSAFSVRAAPTSSSGGGGPGRIRRIAERMLAAQVAAAESERRFDCSAVACLAASEAAAIDGDGDGTGAGHNHHHQRRHHGEQRRECGGHIVTFPSLAKLLAVAPRQSACGALCGLALLAMVAAEHGDVGIARAAVALGPDGFVLRVRSAAAAAAAASAAAAAAAADADSTSTPPRGSAAAAAADAVLAETEFEARVHSEMTRRDRQFRREQRMAVGDAGGGGVSPQSASGLSRQRTDCRATTTTFSSSTTSSPPSYRRLPTSAPPLPPLSPPSPSSRSTRAAVSRVSPTVVIGSGAAAATPALDALRDERADTASAIEEAASGSSTPGDARETILDRPGFRHPVNLHRRNDNDIVVDDDDIIALMDVPLRKRFEQLSTPLQRQYMLHCHGNISTTGVAVKCNSRVLALLGVIGDAGNIEELCVDPNWYVGDRGVTPLLELVRHRRRRHHHESSGGCCGDPSPRLRRLGFAANGVSDVGAECVAEWLMNRFRSVRRDGDGGRADRTATATTGIAAATTLTIDLSGNADIGVGGALALIRALDAIRAGEGEGVAASACCSPAVGLAARFGNSMSRVFVAPTAKAAASATATTAAVSPPSPTTPRACRVVIDTHGTSIPPGLSRHILNLGCF